MTIAPVNTRFCLLCCLFIYSLASTAEHTTETLDTLYVSGQREAFVNAGIAAEYHELNLTPGGVTLIDGDILRERNVSSLSDMLRYVPGVWTSSQNGDDGIFISSRGSNLDATDFDRNGVKMLQDGLPITTADGNNHNRIIDPLSTRYAVFARGANAVKYGASTLGGAVNFVTPTAYDSPAAQLYINGGSHGQLQGRATFSHVFDNELDGLVTVEGKQWDGFRDHNEQKRFGLYANAGWQIADSVGARLYVNYVDNEQQLPGSLSRSQVATDRDQARPAALSGDFQLNLETWRVASKTTWQIDDQRRLDIGFSIEEQSLFHPIVDKVTVPPFGVVFNGLLIDTDHRDLGFMLRYQQQSVSHDLLFGINFGKGRVDGEHFGNAGGVRDGLSTLIDQDAMQLESFVMDRWKIDDQWLLVPSVQLVAASREINNLDVASTITRNPEDVYITVNPGLGLIFNVRQGIDLFANISRLYEPPTNFELDDDVRGSDAALDAMQGTVIEAGTRGQYASATGNTWEWDISLYYAWIRDEILSVEDPAAPGTSLSTNVDRTVHAGVESLLSANVALDAAGRHRIEPKLSLSLNRFRFDDDPVNGNNELPAAPGYVLRGEIIYRHANGFYAGPTFEAVDERFADFANSFVVDDYNLVGFLTGWAGDKVNVYLEINNLLDEEFIATHSVRDRAATDAEILNPGAPLSAFVGMGIRY